MPARSREPRAPGYVRLNKFLADRGVASRRRCDELIAEGKVTVDGRVVTELGTKVDPAHQSVEIAGEVLRADTGRPRYYLLNKPAGVVCTSDPREARPRAVDLITDRRKGRIYTVGRLDEETVGLILLTNDGELANRVSHPRYGVAKTYWVKLDGRVGDDALQKIRDGIHLAEGRTAGARILVQRRTDRQTTLLVTLWEGKNREVRRIFAKLGWNVRGLRRIRIGPLTDRGLKVGHWRPLAPPEVEALYAWSEGERVATRPGSARRRPGRATKRPARRG